MPDHIDLPHLDLPHLDSPHHDLGHQDFGHFDLSHSDSPHLDEGHLDSHQDFGHFDIGHIDLSHTDLPHDDLLHIDDVGHTDFLHTDFGHIDLPHTDDHLDLVHADGDHDDLHLDTGHVDDIHSDIFHMDGLHLDVHFDLSHSDAPFDDGHADGHIDDGHIDVPFEDGHADGGFGDNGFSDEGGGDGGGGDGGGGGGCFTAETVVATPDGGSRPIAEIAVGDLVLARGEETESLTARRVNRVFRHSVDQTLLLRLTGGEALETTPKHRFFVLGQGFVAAGRLRVGEQLVGYPGTDPITLEAVEPRPGPTLVYSLSVEHDPTYLVGPRGLLVHVIKEDTRRAAGSPVFGSRRRPSASSPGAPRSPSAPAADGALLGQFQAVLQIFGQQMAQQIEARDRAADQRLVQVLAEFARFAAELQNALTGLERRVGSLEARSGHQGDAGHGGVE